VPHPQAAALIRDLASRKGVTITGTMMTFTEDPAFDREQRQRFASLTGELKAAGITLGLLHAASTYTLFQHGEEAYFDMVRVGMALLGIYPDAAFKPMRRLEPRFVRHPSTSAPYGAAAYQYSVTQYSRLVDCTNHF
jgi:alanine racemase